MKPIKKLNCELCPKCRIVLNPDLTRCQRCNTKITRSEEDDRVRATGAIIDFKELWNDYSLQIVISICIIAIVIICLLT